MHNIDINKATTEQLRFFASTVLSIANLSPNPDTRPDTLIARIRDAGYTKSTIEVPEETASLTGAPPAKPAGSDNDTVAESGKVKIHIHPASEGENNDDVFVSLNGKGILLPRGKDITVKPGIVEILNNAKRLVYPQNPEGGLGTPREVAQYPFSVLQI